MAKFKKYRAAERELMEGVSKSIRHEKSRSDDHPSHGALRRFAEGKDPVHSTVLFSHLAECEPCIHTMAEIRRRAVVVRYLGILCCVLVAAVAFWVWIGYARPSKYERPLVTLDLRSFSPTRGAAPSANNAPVLPRGVRQLKIILPAGSEGNYDVKLLDDRSQPPLLQRRGEARTESEGVLLEIPLDLSAYGPGQHWLALKRDGADWEYYRLILK